MRQHLCYDINLNTNIKGNMEESIIKTEIVQILSSDSNQDEKVRQFEILIEQIKIAYYVQSANDISRHNAKVKRARQQAVLAGAKSGNIVILSM